MELTPTSARAWLAELDESIVDGDITRYQAECLALSRVLTRQDPPEVINLLEEYYHGTDTERS